MRARLVLQEHPAGVTCEPGNRIVYELATDTAHSGSATVAGPALSWALLTGADAVDEPAGAALAAAELDDSQPWLMRCDRVDFPPGAVAYRHTHPGPGIRRLLFGELTVTTAGVTTTYRAGDAWFESGPEPVYAESSAVEETAFVRVMLLPAEWAGRRTICYADPADADRPARQRARVLLEEPLA
ncbi:MAG: cupin domain-containing protein [bacterium]|nr:cupin domain-containing protein [bacterium]MXZ31558.1 cupin domain-containing protein [Acidimicrobiia bacterium]MYB25357.1 cupin domain-containing protein [Acidimicrobiia bacterium]MYE67041.1 cupin domain-containing protein [Acidimicrobiia bacterium]MYJ13848.1 cupin domain-containing protein [Acidimicrobiia bacterium]